MLSKFKSASWDINTVVGRSKELLDTIIILRINIVCLQETKCLSEKSKEIKRSSYKHWCTGKDREKKQGWNSIYKLVLGENITNVVSAYAL